MTTRATWYGGAALPGLASTVLLLGFLAAAFAAGAGPVPKESVRGSTIRLLLPSAAGSNTDVVVQALAERMASQDDARPIETVHVPGNAGMVALTSFLGEGSGAGLLVTGLSMLDAALLKRAPVSVDRLTPIARFASEPFAVVVPRASPFGTLDELRGVLLADPLKFAWAGGPAGSTDQVGTVLLGRALGIELSALNYVAFLGTSDAVAAAVDGKVAAAFVPISEAVAGLEGSKLRLLAVASEAPLPGYAAPTLREGGVDLVFANWRGLVARPDLSADARAALVRQVEAAVRSPDWQLLVGSRSWQPAFLAGDDFARFILSEQARLEATLKVTGALKRDGE